MQRSSRYKAALLENPEWIDPILDQVTSGVLLNVAVSSSTDKLAAEIGALPNEYLRRRVTDIRDLGARVVRLLGSGDAASLVDRLDGKNGDHRGLRRC